MWNHYHAIQMEVINNLNISVQQWIYALFLLLINVSLPHATVYHLPVLKTILVDGRNFNFDYINSLSIPVWLSTSIAGNQLIVL